MCNSGPAKQQVVTIRINQFLGPLLTDYYHQNPIRVILVHMQSTEWALPIQLLYIMQVGCGRPLVPRYNTMKPFLTSLCASMRHQCFSIFILLKACLGLLFEYMDTEVERCSLFNHEVAGSNHVTNQKRKKIPSYFLIMTLVCMHIGSSRSTTQQNPKIPFLHLFFVHMTPQS